MNKKEKLDEFLTVRELARWIKLSESHVYFMVNKKKIPFAKLGGKLLFDKEKIRKWIDKNSSNSIKEKGKKPGRPKKNKINQVVPLLEKAGTTIVLENLTPNDIDVLD